MSKQLINEAFEWTVQKMKNLKGEIYFIAKIDPKLSQSTFQYKDKIKEFGATWLNMEKTWGFILSGNEENRQKQLETRVKPCVEYLKSVEDPASNKTADDTFNAIIKSIDDLIKAIDTQAGSLTTRIVDTSIDPKEIKDKLAKFKQELIDSFNDDTWKEKMMPIIKFRRAQGPSFSILNSILIYMQDPEATMVKSKGNWERANRTIKPNAPVLVAIRPDGPKVYKTPQQRYAAEKEWLINHGKIQANATRQEIQQAYNDLTVGEKEMVRKKLNAVQVVRYSFEPRWYDVRFTEQMEGKEDLVGSREGIENIEWYDKNSQESQKSAQLFDAMIKVIEKSSVKLTYAGEETLGGARGVSMGGSIQVLSGQDKTPGAVSTLIHEFAHELLHQRYLKDQEKYKDFFIGQAQGRGPVEQQAEITAWIVMRNFGFDMTTAVNYAGIWGADDKNCIQVFDTVGKVATYIINEIYSELGQNQVNEAIGHSVNITGKDVAKMLGAEQLYNKMSQLQIKESFYKILNSLYD